MLGCNHRQIAMKNKKKIKNPPSCWEHVKENWRLYLIVAVVVVSLASSSHLYQSALAAQKSVANWPTAEAEIISSEIDQAHAPPPNKFTITAVVELSYKVDGKTIEARYARTWATSKDLDYKELLKKGNRVNVKYSPIDTTSVSLSPLGP